jgi:heterodisulfide reductase subunit A
VVDVKAVVEAVKKLPGVAYATDLQYSCSDLGQGAIKEAIKEHHLDRVVVSSCSPRMHEIRSLGSHPTKRMQRKRRSD